MHHSANTTGTEPFGLSPEDEGEEEEDDYYEATAEICREACNTKIRTEMTRDNFMHSNVQLCMDANTRQTANMQTESKKRCFACSTLVSEPDTSAGKDYPLHNPNAFAGWQIKNEIELIE